MNTLFLCAGLTILLASSASADGRHVWEISSPDHGQTFAYGSERRQQWLTHGNHLGVAMEFTNDPYVDQIEPRQYDNFIFNFPSVTLGRDRKTFYYRASDGRSIAVAIRRPGFLIDEISLLPSSALVIEKPHGRLSLSLVVSDSIGAPAPD
jgi:hypothetical protein